MSNFRIIDIPGIMPIKMAVLDNKDDEHGHVKSPEWMVRIDDITDSEVEGYQDFCELYGWYGEASRFSSPDVSSSFLNTSAALKHSELILMIPNGGYNASLEMSMNTGKAVEKLTILRLGHIGDTKVKIQQIDYTTCRIHSLQQQLDRLIIRTNVATKNNTLFIYDQKGVQKGQMVSYVNYIKNKVEN